LYICAFWAPGLPADPALAAQESADAFYADRANPSSARRAADLWSRAAAVNPRDFTSAWKLARVQYWIGGHVPAPERRAAYEHGVTAARQAIAIDADRAEGHFWLAANLGALAESSGIAGLKHRKAIRIALETVLRLDPAFQQGSADRALGRWYHKVPRLFGGSHRKAEEHLKASLKYNAHSTVTHYFLAQLYEDDGRVAEARAEIQKVIDAPSDPDWEPEDREYKMKARTLLSTLE
jgi:tetratricopeptide (TPR) repeat protein